MKSQGREGLVSDLSVGTYCISTLLHIYIFFFILFYFLAFLFNYMYIYIYIIYTQDILCTVDEDGLWKVLRFREGSSLGQGLSSSP